METSSDEHAELTERKKDGQNDMAGWISLEHHIADVAACSERLLENKILRTRIASLGGMNDLDEVQRQRLCVLAGLHDIGLQAQSILGKKTKLQLFPVADTKDVAALLNSDDPKGKRFREKLNADVLSNWFVSQNGFERLLTAAISCGEQNQLATGHRRVWMDATREKDPFGSITNLINLLHKWFPNAWPPGGSLLPESRAFGHSLSGLITMAHSLASDFGFFPPASGTHPAVEESKAASIEPDPGQVELSAAMEISRLRCCCGPRFSLSRRLADNAVNLCGLDGSSYRNSLEPDETDFAVGPTTGFGAIHRVFPALSIPESGSITILETGDENCKAETAIPYFLKLFRDSKVDGLFYALPERNAAARIYPSIRDAIDRAFSGEREKPPVVLALPDFIECTIGTRCGKAFRTIDFSGFQDDKFQFRIKTAEGPEMQLFGPIVVGTIGQVMLSSLPTNQAHMRATALLRHLLIVDDVRTSGTLTNRILEEVLKRHVTSGGHALLMSSALSASTRQRFVHLGKRGQCPKKEKANSVSFPLAIQVEYVSKENDHLSPEPKVIRKISVDSFFQQPNHVKPVFGFPTKSRPGFVDVTVKTAPCWERPDTVAQMGLYAARDGAKVLILRNTLQDCLATQASIERIAKTRNLQNLLFGVSTGPGKTVYAPSHPFFSTEDRHTLDLTLKDRFGKSSRENGCVVSADQTASKSGDIEFDLVITDLCPMDVLCRRLNRLKSAKETLENKELPAAIVLVDQNRDLSRYINSKWESGGPCGIGTIFPDLRFLEATWRTLESRPRFRIPRDYRKLVEESSHPEIFREIEKELGTAWENHGRKITGSLTADVLAARINLTLYNLDFQKTIDLFPETKELSKRIRALSGMGDHLVEFTTALESGFGNKIKQLVIPATFISSMDPESKPGRVKRIDSQSCPVGWSFMYGNNQYLYDRWGLRNVLP